MGCDPEVIRPRLERGTDCLEGSCSIQLSYRTDMRTGHECTEMKAQGEGENACTLCQYSWGGDALVKESREWDSNPRPFRYE